MEQKQILKKATWTDTSNLAIKSNLAKLKAKVNKAYVDKLKTAPVDLSKLSDVVNNEVLKKIVYNKLAAKVNNIDTSGFVLKTKYDIYKSSLEKKITDAEKKIPKTSAPVKTTDYDAKMTEVESKIPSVTDSDLVKKKIMMQKYQALKKYYYCWLQ